MNFEFKTFAKGENYIVEVIGFQFGDCFPDEDDTWDEVLVYLEDDDGNDIEVDVFPDDIFFAIHDAARAEEREMRGIEWK